MDVLWFIPTHGDGRYLASNEGSRPTTFPYLRQIARAVDGLGFNGALLPTGRHCEDAWVLAAEKIAAVRELAAANGRSVRFGMRLRVIVRETASAAWDAANGLIRHVDDAAIAAASATFAASESVGQQRMYALHQGRRDSLEISPNLWAGVGLVRGGAGTALVGDPGMIAERMFEDAELLFPRLPIRANIPPPATRSASGWSCTSSPAARSVMRAETIEARSQNAEVRNSMVGTQDILRRDEEFKILTSAF
ncbi:MAG TPA: LLM class flavin-dependent oxidoreductase [Herpetosiphonaceae bacterium]|nr:LLM class flavin-dependent oxidoreductase [Herpetosiphonaceae bacterium]